MTLRVAIFGNGALATMVLRTVTAQGHEVALACSRPAAAPLRATARRLLARLRPDDFTCRQPFSHVPRPQAEARSVGALVFSSTDLHEPEFLDRFRRARLDLLLVAGFHRLVPAPLLAVPSVGAVNFHPSLLPRHRGGTPNRWVVLYGESESGLTAHLMTPRFDDGAVVAQRRVPVAPDDTWGDVEDSVLGLTPVVTQEVLAAATLGRLTGEPQDERLATSEPSLRPVDCIIDWREPAERARRKALAVRPLSGARFRTARGWACLWEADALPDAATTVAPGTVLRTDDEGVLVACGDGVVRIRSVLRRGQIVPATELLDECRPGTTLPSA